MTLPGVAPEPDTFVQPNVIETGPGFTVRSNVTVISDVAGGVIADGENVTLTPLGAVSTFGA